MYRILHLSDLHFGDMHYFRQTTHDEETSSLAQTVSDALARLKTPNLDGLVLSGDFFSKDAPADLALATDNINELIATLKIQSDAVFLVPGNHDLTWDVRFSGTPLRFYKELTTNLGISNYSIDGEPHVAVLSNCNVNR